MNAYLQSGFTFNAQMCQKVCITKSNIYAFALNYNGIVSFLFNCLCMNMNCNFEAFESPTRNYALVNVSFCSEFVWCALIRCVAGCQYVARANRPQIMRCFWFIVSIIRKTLQQSKRDTMRRYWWMTKYPHGQQYSHLVHYKEIGAACRCFH